METFIFAGSKGGAGRSVSSILFATGLSALGLRPLYLQVLATGRPPLLDGTADLPFATDHVTWNEAESLGLDLQAPIARHPTCSPIVVDMTSQRVRGPLVAAPEVRILLPMRTGAAEVEWAAHDYRDAEEDFARQTQRRQRLDAGRPPIWFLPVGWPCEPPIRGLRGHPGPPRRGGRGVGRHSPSSFLAFRSWIGWTSSPSSATTALIRRLPSATPPLPSPRRCWLGPAARSRRPELQVGMIVPSAAHAADPNPWRP